MYLQLSAVCGVTNARGRKPGLFIVLSKDSQLVHVIGGGWYIGEDGGVWRPQKRKGTQMRTFVRWCMVVAGSSAGRDVVVLIVQL